MEDAVTYRARLDNAKAEVDAARRAMGEANGSAYITEARRLIRLIDELFLPLLAEATEYATAHPVRSVLAGLGTRSQLRRLQAEWLYMGVILNGLARERNS